MRCLIFKIVFFIVFLSACGSQTGADKVVRVLFVGNSLTYVGNLPAVLDALGAANNRKVQSDMIVKGGATLIERVLDHSVERALKTNKYDYVIFQERGGEVLCGFGPKSCEDANIAMTQLTKFAHENDSKPILLGTYQKPSHISELLVAEESGMARQLSIAYVSISDKLQKAMQQYPNANWFYVDNGHPGHDLILLEAMVLYREIFAVQANISELMVNAPMFTPSAQFSEPSPVSQKILSKDVSLFYNYTKEQIAVVQKIIAN